MLSTSRDDAFSNNLRQYDALWFVNGRGPADGDGPSFPVRFNNLFTRAGETLASAYLRKARFGSATLQALIARNECTLRHVRRRVFPALGVARSLARAIARRNQKDTRVPRITVETP